MVQQAVQAAVVLLGETLLAQHQLEAAVLVLLEKAMLVVILLL
jgi:hypothetical protein